MAKSKRNTARKAKTTKRTRPTKPDLVAALNKLSRAIDAVDLALTDHSAAVDTQRILHRADDGRELSDAFGWVLDKVYETRQTVVDIKSPMWDALQELGDMIDPGRKERRAQFMAGESAANV
jgi:hypothetical protein